MRITADEANRIAEYLGLEIHNFRTTYTRPPDDPAQAAAGDLYLLEKPGPGQECIMLEENLCRINPVKPSQCVGFPLKWRTPDIMDYCEGMRA